MRIEPPRPELLDRAALARELTALLRQPDARAVRPCRGCHLPCPCSKSHDCTCACTPECDNIARVSSSDPERYPIEPAVVPLIYELNALRLVQTCWSCEGHRDAGDRLVKRPRVWFYSRAASYAQLLSEYLATLCARKSLRHPWQVSLVSMGERACATYSIEPALETVEITDLAVLHHDLAVIGAGLAHRIRGLAAQALDALGAPHRPG